MEEILMAGQQKLVLTSLKKILKSKGINYELLAKKLDLSLPTIKRMFSKEDMNLSRLEDICDAAGIKLTDVFRLVETVSEGVSEELSLEQEQYFYKNPSRFSYFDLLLNGMKIKQIEKIFKLSPAQTTKILRDLEKIGVIDWQSDFKVRLKTSTVIKLRNKGPLQKLFMENGVKDFLNSNFADTSEYQEFMTLRVSDKTYKKLGLQLKTLLAEIAREGEFENQTGIQTESIGIYLAIRHWNVSDAFGL